jgi:hypothetical protein
MQELDPNILPTPRRRRRRRRRPLTDVSTDEPAPRRQRPTRQPPVTASVNIYEDPPADPPIIRPPGFLSCFRPAPSHTLGPLTGYCTACGALHFCPTDNVFVACCKKGDVILPRIREPPPYLSYIFTGDDPLCRAFRANIRAYNCALAFTSISYKKDTRINFSRGIQCFQIYGELFHFQSPLRPALHEEPSVGS